MSELSREVSDLLRCPVTGQPLRQATSEELEGLVDQFPEGAYITEDASRLYPVEDGFPILIEASAKQLNCDS